MKLEYCPTCYLNYLGKIFTVAVIAALFTITAFDASAQSRGNQRQATDIAPTSKKSTIQATEIRSAKSSSPQAQGKQYTPTVILAVEASAVSTSQCANGKASEPEVCNDTDSWVNGNVNQAKAHYNEGDSIAYRAVFTGLTPGQTYTYGMTWDTTKSGKHAIDYLTTYNRTEEDADPCFDQSCSGENQIGIPLDPRVTAGPTSPFAGDNILPGPDGTAGTADDATPISGYFTMWNGALTGVGSFVVNKGSYNNTTGLYSDDSSTAITVTFTANSSTVVLAWGGHISHRKDWGADSSATSIPGSPYHMANFSWSDGTVGSADLQLAASAVSITASIRIIKALANGLEAAGHDFTFTHSITGGSGVNFLNSGTGGDFASGTFVLDVDGGADTAFANEITSELVTGLSSSAGISATGTITEQLGPGDFTLQSIVCSESGPVGYTNSASIANVGTRTVSVNLQEGELLTCTFTNNVVLAADATITGRVLTSGGYGIRNAYVTITDVNTGEVRTVLTNQFGYYTFANLEVGHFFSLRVSARRYTFSNPTQSFSLGDSLANVNFVAN